MQSQEIHNRLFMQQLPAPVMYLRNIKWSACRLVNIFHPLCCKRRKKAEVLTHILKAHYKNSRVIMTQHFWSVSLAKPFITRSALSQHRQSKGLKCGVFTTLHLLINNLAKHHKIYHMFCSYFQHCTFWYFEHSEKLKLNLLHVLFEQIMSHASRDTYGVIQNLNV